MNVVGWLVAFWRGGTREGGGCLQEERVADGQEVNLCLGFEWIIGVNVIVVQADGGAVVLPFGVTGDGGG